MSTLRKLAGVLVASAVVAACAPDTVPLIGGETLWINVAQGRLKAQVFAREEVSDLTPAVSPGRE
jgi:hypothetical protein